MIDGASRGRVLAVVLSGSLAAIASAPPAHGQERPSGRARLLDVPYLPQSEALCGGAAVAMVMRYWGARDIYADAFAPLVDRDAGGIRASALAADVERRSWTAIAGPSDAGRVRQQLERGRPVIVLIEDRPGRFHYVVIVGWVGGSVILHDPARAPFQVINEASFTHAWQQAGRWTLVALPPSTLSQPAAADVESASRPGGACAGFVEEGVRLAQNGDRPAARRALQTAADLCASDSATFRELAGLDALEREWPAAEEHARQAVAHDPRDEHAWRILATAAYLQHHDADALEAWNHIGEPSVDLVNVSGLRRTRYAIVGAALDLAPGTLLTPSRLQVAERRAREVPSLAAARVSFHPTENGRAQVDVSVIERAAAPATVVGAAALGLHAATDREVVASFASFTGGGELATVFWRWWEHRPALGFSFAAPAPRALGGGVWRVDVARETETFGVVPFGETRSRAEIALGKWLTERARVEGTVSLDRYGSRGTMAGLGGAIGFRPIDDRLSIEGRAATWVGQKPRFGSGWLRTRWRSTNATIGSVWLATAGAQIASADAPELLWPGADTGRAREVLLRAHPLLDDGVIAGGVFGRRLVFGGAEWRRWSMPFRWPIRLAPAAFVDVARASRGLPSSDRRTHVDAGAGLRLSLAGLGVMRVDVARGLRDGRTALTVGWAND